jgi:two-component system cell cycle sensor histidine kinase/response regulator CckA
MRRPDTLDHPARILIIDDNAHVRELLTVMLAPEGYELLTAASGKEALDLVAKQPPDLILLDVMMSDIDGYQVAARIKADRASENVPIVMVTALEDREAKLRGLGAGAEDFLSKPVDRAELCARVKNLLRLKAYGDYIRSSNRTLEAEVQMRTADLRHERDRARQAANALRIEQERTRFALRAADVGIWDLDYMTGVLDWSETSEAHYGVARGTFGATFEAFVARIHPDDREAVIEAIAGAARSGTEFATRHRSIWPDGTVHWLSGAGRVLLGENGQPVRGVGITLDITARRRLEEHHQQFQKMEAVGRLASGVAHDFNNLLTVILGFSEMLTADSLSDQQRNDLEEVVKATNRASGLTRQLLAFSRQQVMTTAPLDVNALITDMTAMLCQLIGAHIDVVVTLAPEVLPVLADRSQLEQVVMNLVLNARDSMSGGGRLTIVTAVVDLDDSALEEHSVIPGRYVMLSVTDTGVGMSKQTQEHLFEPFFTTKTAGKGTGLGLSTTYGVVKQSNGDICVDSELNRGTTLKVYLPRSEASVPAPGSSQPVVTPVERPVETVLLVEDEASVRQLSKRVLEHAGYRILEATNGRDAEHLFATHPGSIDLVVTDVVMPGCGGPELISRLQRRAPLLRVLYMSGYSDTSSGTTAALDRGHFIQKPFTAVEFARQVRAALDAPQVMAVSNLG